MGHSKTFVTKQVAQGLWDEGTLVKHPEVNDVLLGRGNGTASHPGNVMFRHTIWQYKDSYKKASRHMKREVAQEVVHSIGAMNPPGRFLEKGLNEDTYSLVSFQRAVEKASQALRERKTKIPDSVIKELKEMRNLTENQIQRNQRVSKNDARTKAEKDLVTDMDEAIEEYYDDDNFLELSDKTSNSFDYIAPRETIRTHCDGFSIFDTPKMFTPLPNDSSALKSAFKIPITNAEKVQVNLVTPKTSEGVFWHGDDSAPTCPMSSPLAISMGDVEMDSHNPFSSKILGEMFWNNAMSGGLLQRSVSDVMQLQQSTSGMLLKTAIMKPTSSSNAGSHFPPHLIGFFNAVFSKPELFTHCEALCKVNLNEQLKVFELVSQISDIDGGVSKASLSGSPTTVFFGEDTCNLPVPTRLEVSNSLCSGDGGTVQDVIKDFDPLEAWNIFSCNQNHFW